MQQKLGRFRGCLLGLAVGDAMGYTVDAKTLDEICADYGPNGLLGYDLVNGYAEITSHTQLAAFSANGLLLALTHQQMGRRSAPYIRYLALAVREWSRSQRYCEPEKNHCWLSTVPEMKRRRCMDTMMLSYLDKDPLGTPENPTNYSNLPAALAEAIPIALLSDRLFLPVQERDHLAAQAVAMTHGNPEAFLSAAVLCHVLSDLLGGSDASAEELAHKALSAAQQAYGADHPHMSKLWELYQMALTLASSDNLSPMAAMERLGCQSAAEVLAGVLYACTTCHGDFDAAMITAVNHSGRSAAVGALTGALLGAKLGEAALPEFYLESLDTSPYLLELADDLFHGCPMDFGSSLFDDDWDRKYLHAGL